jgi:hypothetical protein
MIISRVCIKDIRATVLETVLIMDTIRSHNAQTVPAKQAPVSGATPATAAPTRVWPSPYPD